MLLKHWIRSQRASRGQGLSLTTIVVAILVLIVLVVVIAIFSGKISVFGDGAESCTTRNGECSSRCGNGEVEIPGTECSKTNEICCVSVYG